MPESPKALILLASRPETVEAAVGKLRPETLGVIRLGKILGAAALDGPEQKVKYATL